MRAETSHNSSINCKTVGLSLQCLSQKPMSHILRIRGYITPLEKLTILRSIFGLKFCRTWP